MTDNALITALQDPKIYDHPVDEIRLVETHISWVILTGDFVYKIKKPVNFGFLDFSTLELRRHYCEQELKLNRRLAPRLYLDVIKVIGPPERPIMNGEGEAIEYAVKMRQFDPERQLDRLAVQNKLTTAHIDQLADVMAAFHEGIEMATAESAFGSPASVWQPAAENFSQIAARLDDEHENIRLESLRQWSREQFNKFSTLFQQRKRGGFIRNCHGDMHLANMTLIDDEVTIFDCIEFNDDFRWIDVISELAFTSMDLIDRGQPGFAARLVNRYLQHTGDYEGLALLQFYQVYRALVRAKVAILRSGQPDLSEQQRRGSWQEYRAYSELAQRFTRPANPALFIAHGVSGAGKTTLTQALLERFGMIRLRSDVERKRLFGLTAAAKSRSDTGRGIYTQTASGHTYQRLRELAGDVIRAGYSTIVDATFLKCEQRRLFQALAQELGVPFIILHFHADAALLRRWISERLTEGKDASEATLEVLDHQLKTQEPLTAGEADRIISIDSGRNDAAEMLVTAVKKSL